MGKKSTNPDKCLYWECREQLGLSREAAAEKLGMSDDALERFERGTTARHPDVVWAMSQAYDDPTLCNHYCTTECAIGRRYVQPVQARELKGIVLNMMASLNAVKELETRLVAITHDGSVDDGEISEFQEIQDELEKLAGSVNDLQLWADKAIDEDA